MEEKIERVVSEIYPNSWEEVNDYFGEDDPPYLYTSMRQASQDLYGSIGESSLKRRGRILGATQMDISAPQIVGYTVKIPPKIIGGSPTLEFYLEGIVIPEERIEDDSKEELLIQLAQEGVRTKLRCKSPVYDLTTFSPQLQLIEDLISGAITDKILEWVPTSDLVDIFCRNREKLEPYRPLGILLEKERVIESFNKLEETLADHNPIEEWGEFFAPFLKGKAKREADSFYDRFSEVNFELKRRNTTGEWEEIKLPKLSRIAKPRIIKPFT